MKYLENCKQYNANWDPHICCFCPILQANKFNKGCQISFFSLKKFKFRLIPNNEKKTLENPFNSQYRF